jgi:hypothetical protein
MADLTLQPTLRLYNHNLIKSLAGKSVNNTCTDHALAVTATSASSCVSLDAICGCKRLTVSAWGAAIVSRGL